MRSRRLNSILILLLAIIWPAAAQRNASGQTDSVVVLMNAKSIELLQMNGQSYRKALEARFLHNNTYLLCDTALWNVDTKVINAIGHVKIMQDRTVLTSDKLEYVIDIDLARFRGDLVELKDKDGNILRTNYLDYNTKDSTAFFERGASMKEKSGQVIESYNGSYDSKDGLFTFNRDVNMYTDSVFVKTQRLYYHSQQDSAVFESGLDAWKDNDMISSRNGYYARTKEQFLFRDDVHIMSQTQEGWSDSLYFNRGTNDIDMRGNVQVTDTSRHVSGLSHRLFYVDTLSKVTMTGEAAVIAETDQGGEKDTVYFGADMLSYWTIPKCDVPEHLVNAAQTRLTAIASDPVSTYRAKAAEEAAKEAEEAAEDDPNRPPQDKKKADSDQISKNARDIDVDSLKLDSENIDGEEGEGSELDAEQNPALSDSLSVVLPPDPEQLRLDSLARADSIANAKLQAYRDSLANRDTTAIGFMRALGRIRMFKSDMQMACDSLEYSDLDSLARLFVSPIVWNEERRQYTSDSIYVAIKDQKMDKANLMSNAFIVIEEEPGVCYDQIKGAEIMAYFDSTTVLRRFDALGGANALFFLEEEGAFATVNKVESKMLSAIFVEGEIDRLYYFDSPKNDAYPVVQLPKEERQMKGFNWNPDDRPKSGDDITTLSLRPLEMDSYQRRSRCNFRYTNRYFPGHIDSIREMLAAHKAGDRSGEVDEESEEEQLDEPLVDEEIVEDVQELDGQAPEGLESAADETTGEDAEVNDDAEDNGEVAPAPEEEEEHILTPEEIRAQKEAERKRKQDEAAAKRQAKIDAKEARWAELDRRDAEKQAAKDAKAQVKYRKKALKAVIAAEKQAAKDQARLDKYIERYEKKMAKKLSKMITVEDVPEDDMVDVVPEETLDE